MPSGSSGEANSFSVMLAREVAADLNVPFCNVLEPQGQKGKSAPIKSANLKPYVVNEIIAGPILVIDDVMTSGHTVNEFAACLKRHGAARVTNLVFARTIAH